jgi:competence protein ComGB
MHVLFQKNLAYPLLMLAVSLAGILVFNTFCFPAMLSMMEGFAPADSSLTAMAALLRISSYSMLALLAAAAFLGICLLPSKNRVKAYERLCRTPLGSLWVQYESLNFARFLTESLRAGLATQQAMTMFSSLSFHPLAADLARKTEKALQEGESLDAAMQGPEFDPLLPRFLRLAAYVEEPADLLESYLEMGTKRLEARIHRLLKVLEGISYACIGYMVILVYQVLMLPLNLLGSF